MSIRLGFVLAFYADLSSARSALRRVVYCVWCMVCGVRCVSRAIARSHPYICFFFFGTRRRIGRLIVPVRFRIQNQNHGILLVNSRRDDVAHRQEQEHLAHDHAQCSRPRSRIKVPSFRSELGRVAHLPRSEDSPTNFFSDLRLLFKIELTMTTLYHRFAYFALRGRAIGAAARASSCSTNTAAQLSTSCSSPSSSSSSSSSSCSTSSTASTRALLSSTGAGSAGNTLVLRRSVASMAQAPTRNPNLTINDCMATLESDPLFDVRRFSIFEPVVSDASIRPSSSSSSSLRRPRTNWSVLGPTGGGPAPSRAVRSRSCRWRPSTRCSTRARR